LIKATEYNMDRAAILERIGPEKIFSYYLKLPIDNSRLFKSPLRVDNHPTCSFYIKNDTLLFHDFGRGKSYGPIDVVMELYSLSYKDALKKIVEDEQHISKLSLNVKLRPAINLDVIFDGWNDEYLSYWKQFGIAEKTLKKFWVNPVRTVYNNESLYMRSTKANPIYGYKFPSSRVKLYRPLSPDKEKKWRGNASAEDISGLVQLPSKGVVLFVTSSLKDVMVLHELGFPAIAFNGEAFGISGISKPIMSSALNILKRKFRFIYFFMNSDEPGMVDNYKLSSVHKLPCVYTPIGGPKDISDYMKKYKKEKTFKLIKKLLCKECKKSGKYSA
jgi:hypothetical protein